MSENKKIVVIGGGTFSHVRNHLALAAPAFGRTAKNLAQRFSEQDHGMQVILKLTRMACPTSELVTNSDVERYLHLLVADPSTKIVVLNAALCDFTGQIGDVSSSSKAERIHSREGDCGMKLSPARKLVGVVRKQRKDIFLVAFKTTTGASEDDQYTAGLHLLKEASCNLVVANDTLNGRCMIITPEEARYHVTYDRDTMEENLVEMTLSRSRLTFTRSTVVPADPVVWDSEEVPETLRSVVDFCIQRGAYKAFRGATVGHFASKVDHTTFLTSRRKANFNDMGTVGLVRVKAEGPDSVIAYGGKPSVGGQSQRSVFNDHPGYDHIVHFHCPLREDAADDIPVVPQREYECGSHECGHNTSSNLKDFGNGIKAVMLDHHGPNIVFRNDVRPEDVIRFIERNFDLSDKTGGTLP